MKLIIDAEKMFKLTITQEGQLSVNLANGKQYAGPLAPAELEQIMFRASALSDGAIKFDPAPTDYISMHEEDMKTLESQSVAINELRETVESQRKIIEKHQEDVARLVDCENELSKARVELKDITLVVQQQADKLGIIAMKEAMATPDVKPEAAIIADSPPA